MYESPWGEFFVWGWIEGVVELSVSVAQKQTRNRETNSKEFSHGLRILKSLTQLFQSRRF